MVRMLDGELDPTEEDGLKDIFPVASRKQFNETSHHTNQSHTSGMPLRTSSRLRKSKQRADRKYVTIRKTSTVKDIKIEVRITSAGACNSEVELKPLAARGV
jgi:hypothetical protein